MNDAVVDSAIIFSNTCFWNTAGFNDINKLVYIFQDTIMMNPDFKNATEPDFSLPEGSGLLSFANDNSAIGDPGWKFHITSVANFIDSESLSLTCYPNPFSENLKIEYVLKIKNSVSVKIYNILGNEIETLINQTKTAGSHSIIWNAKNKQSGIYFCTIKSGNYSETKKLY